MTRRIALLIASLLLALSGLSSAAQQATPALTITSPIVVEMGAQLPLSAMLGDAPAANVRWSSSEDDVAVVDAETGVVTGVMAGFVAITVTSENQTATVNLVVRRPPGQIFVGGATGMDSLLDPLASERLRALGVSLYLHGQGWNALTDAQRQYLVELFAPIGPIITETAQNAPIPEGQPNWEYSTLPQLDRAGATPHLLAVLTNAGDPMTTPQEWQEFVDQWKAFGVHLFSHIETPNERVADETLVFGSPAFDDFRARAHIGGMIVLDSPPDFYYWQTEPYRQWVRDAIVWANREGLVSAVIFSPPFNDDATEFVTSAERLVSEFNELPPEERPQIYVIENYDEGLTIESEDDSGSIASVALWVAQNALTYTP